MSPKLTPQERLRLIKRVVEGKEKVARVCREAGISRVLFYRWLKRYREANYQPKVLTPKTGGPVAPKPVIRELSPQERLRMIERVAAGEPVAMVCRDYGVSRVIFYRWKKRYEAAPEGEKLEALWDKRPHPSKYYRQAPENVEKAVLSVIIQYPELSTHKIVEFLPQIGGKPILGNHGVQNVLKRHNLTTYQQRLAYSLARRHVPGIYDRFLHVFQTLAASILALPAKRRLLTVRFTASFLLGVFTGIVIFGAQGYLAMFGQAPVENKVGLIFASIALSAGSFFFLYSLKYYLTLAIVLGFSRHVGETGGNGGNGKGYVGGLQPNLDHVKLERFPFVSIHLPLYNEKKVVDRLLTACTSMDYENYEVVVIDDSTDETTKILEDWKNHPRVKIIHRESREGFKGGALREALRASSPKTEFVVVFDADFIPYPDTITQFLKYFQSVAGSLDFKEASSNQRLASSSSQLNASSLNASSSKIAAIQGYQWHVLNKSENWITRGVRSEYAGSYVVERSGTEVLGALKQIAGSVYMIRADLLRRYGWGTSITEDFQLTLKLYEQGYKVVYTPYVQGPAECVATIKRLVRQRMRWAEGHSHNIREMAVRLLSSPNLTPIEKLEFLYLSPYYLQAFFFMIGTLAWLISETVFRARLPFWTSLWGWSLVLTNLFSLPLMNTVGLFLEESEERDYLGILSFVALSYLLVPFQAYASLKGFLEREEGPWFRTPKTGLITDIFTRGRFYRWISGILPGRAAPAAAQRLATSELASSWKTKLTARRYTLDANFNPYLSLATANNQFSNFKIRPRHIRWLGNLVFTLFIFLTSALIVFAPLLPLTQSTMAQGPGRLMTVGEAMAAQEPKEEEITTPRSFHFPTASGETLEMIFHKEPRVRIKIGDKELEITTKSIANLPALPKRSLIKENHEVIYEEIIPNVDLVYSLNALGFEEKFIVKKKIELEKIEQLVIPKEVKVVSPFEEVFGFYDQENKEIFEFGNPVIYEQETPGVKNQGAKITLKKGPFGYNLRKVITSEGLNWISAPERKYPIIIDPSTIVSGGIVTNMVKYGGNQRKLAYVNSAWYAVREDVGATADLGNVYFYKSTNGTSWSGGTSLDTDTDCASQRSGPSMWVEGTNIWIVWNSRNCTTYDDRLYFRPLDTSTDTLGTLCYSADLGTIGGADVNSIAKIGTTVYTVNDNDPDFMQTTNLTTCTGGTNWAVITTGHGVTATDRPVLDTNGTDLYVFFQDGQLSFSRFAGGSWTPANLTVSATTSTRFSAANDGTKIYLASIDSATNDIDLHTCTISTNCDVAGEWTAETNHPWTGLTNPNTVSVTLNPSAGHIFVSVVYGTAGSAKAYFKDSVTSSISWTEEYDYGWTAGTVEETSSMYSVTDSTKIGVVLMSGTNFEFSTVPEKSLILLLLAPFLPGALKKIREQRRGLWKRK